MWRPTRSGRLCGPHRHHLPMPVGAWQVAEARAGTGGGLLLHRHLQVRALDHSPVPPSDGHSRCAAGPPAAPRLWRLGSGVKSVCSPFLVPSARLWSPGLQVRLSLGPDSLPASHRHPRPPPNSTYSHTSGGVVKEQESAAFPCDWGVLSTVQTPKATRCRLGWGPGPRSKDGSGRLLPIRPI